MTKLKTVPKAFLLLLFITYKCFAQSNISTSTEFKSRITASLQKKDYEKTEKLIKSYLERNPYDNEIIYLGGQNAYYLEKWEKAISYFSRAIKGGYNIPESEYNIACCYALNDDQDQAYIWLQKAIDDHPSFYYQWMEDKDLSSLSKDKMYFDNLYKYDKFANDRESNWRADIDFFSARMKQFHYNLFANIEEQQWDKKIVELKKDVGSLNDNSIIVKLMELVTLFGDGHTVLVPPTSGKHKFSMAPFFTYIFNEGVIVTETHEKYSELLCSKLIAINDIPIQNVLDKISLIISADNRLGKIWLEPLALSIPDLLFGLGIIDNIKNYSLTFEKDQIKKTISIQTQTELTSDFLETWLYGYHELKDWVKVKQLRTPSSQSRAEEPYWFEYLKGNKVVLFHYNQVKTKEEENEYQFIKRLNQFIDANEVDALVIDLRYNEGGDNTVYRPILNGIISNKKINKENHLFALIGRRTFSAGMCFAAELEKSTNTTFVGEPTGSSPNFVGESGGVFKLPYSGIFVNASNLFWQNSYAFDKRKYITPDVYVPATFDDYLKGIDGPLDKVMQLIK